MKLILIDPKERTVTEVEHDGTLASLYALLDVRTIAFMYADNFSIVVDDEGLFAEEPHFFMLEGQVPTPICGRALICDADDDGKMIPCERFDRGQIEDQVTWIAGMMAISGRVFAEEVVTGRVIKVDA